MKPEDFLTVATQLAALRTEAALRSAVSRAYYGAFHAAVALIREMGVALPVGPESHQKVAFCLMESGEAPGREAGSALQTLRKRRNRADYELAASPDFSKERVDDSLDRARIIINHLLRCREGAVGTRFRVKLRDYPANVLRLPVP